MVLKNVRNAAKCLFRLKMEILAYTSLIVTKQETQDPTGGGGDVPECPGEDTSNQVAEEQTPTATKKKKLSLLALLS